MRKEYSPWEYAGYSGGGLRTALQYLNRGEVEEAKEKLEDILEQYELLNMVNFGEKAP